MCEADLKLLRKMPIFGALNDSTLQLLVDEAELKSVASGAYFFREGDRAGSLYVLQKGAVVVERQWNEQPVIVGRLGEGDCFGEMSLIDLMPRSASVRADQDCQAMEIKFASLNKLYRRELEQYAIIMMNMGREVSRRLRLFEQRLFSLSHRVPDLMI